MTERKESRSDGRRETTVAGAAAMMSVDVGAGGSPVVHAHAEEADEPDFRHMIRIFLPASVESISNRLPAFGR
jgi:hypothetical protein